MGEQQHAKFPQEIIDEYAGARRRPARPVLRRPPRRPHGRRRSSEASAERVVGTMPVEGNTQPYGLLHGGASAVLAETLGSVGSMLHGGSSARSPSASTSTAPTTAACAPAWSPAWPHPCTAGAPRPRTRSSSPTSRASASAPPG